MDSSSANILYMSGCLPNRSETFVYQEILALRSLGLNVKTASVHLPIQGLGSDDLDRLANSAIQIYSTGTVALVIDALTEVFYAPFQATKTISQVVFDAFFSAEVTFGRRPKILWQGLASLALTKRLRGLNIKHIHAHMAHVPTTIAMYAAYQLNISFSFTGHANDLFPNRTLLKEKIKRALFVNCISYWHRDFYKKIYDKHLKSLPIIRCGIDTDVVKVVQVPHKKKMKVLSVGRLVKKKGFDVLIKAAGLIAERGNFDLSFTIAGGGPELSNLEKIVSSLPASTQVKLIGEIQNKTVCKLMEECDVFVLPCRVSETSDRDGIPVVLMEAMGRGRCVVSGDLPTIRELIENNVSGILIPPENVLALVYVLEMLCHSHKLVDKIGKAARKVIEDEFDLQINAQRIISTMRMHDIVRL